MSSSLKSLSKIKQTCCQGQICASSLLSSLSTATTALLLQPEGDPSLVAVGAPSAVQPLLPCGHLDGELRHRWRLHDASACGGSGLCVLLCLIGGGIGGGRGCHRRGVVSRGAAGLEQRGGGGRGGRFFRSCCRHMRSRGLIDEAHFGLGWKGEALGGWRSLRADTGVPFPRP